MHKPIKVGPFQFIVGKHVSRERASTQQRFAAKSNEWYGDKNEGLANHTIEYFGLFERSEIS